MASALQTVAMFSNVLQYKPTFAESLQIHSAAAFRQNQLLMEQELRKAKRGRKLKDELEGVQDDIQAYENNIENRNYKRKEIISNKQNYIRNQKQKRAEFLQNEKDQQDRKQAQANNKIQDEKEKLNKTKGSLSIDNQYTEIAKAHAELVDNDLLKEDAKTIKTQTQLQNFLEKVSAPSTKKAVILGFKNSNKVLEIEGTDYLVGTDIEIEELANAYVVDFNLGSKTQRDQIGAKQGDFNNLFNQEENRIERNNASSFQKGRALSDEEIETYADDLYGAKLNTHDGKTKQQQDLLLQAREDEAIINEMMMGSLARDPSDVLRQRYGVTDPFSQSPVLRERRMRMEGETPIDREIQRLANVKIPVMEESKGPPAPPLVKAIVEPIRKVTDFAENMPIVGRTVKFAASDNVLAPQQFLPLKSSLGQSLDEDLLNEQIRQQQATDIQKSYKKRAEQTRKQQERREQAASILETGKEKVQGLFRRDETATKKAIPKVDATMDSDTLTANEKELSDLKGDMLAAGFTKEEMEGKTFEELVEMRNAKDANIPEVGETSVDLSDKDMEAIDAAIEEEQGEQKQEQPEPVEETIAPDTKTIRKKMAAFKIPDRFRIFRRGEQRKPEEKKVETEQPDPPVQVDSPNIEIQDLEEPEPKPEPESKPEPKPEPKTHTVVAGDSLGKIAEKNNTSVEKLMEINGIEDRNKIDVGQVIILEDTKEQLKEKRQNLENERQNIMDEDPSQYQKTNEIPKYEEGQKFQLKTETRPDTEYKFGQKITDQQVITAVTFRNNKAEITQTLLFKIDGKQDINVVNKIIDKEDYKKIKTIEDIDKLFYKKG